MRFGIVIQGPINYYRQIATTYVEIANKYPVVWVIWEDESEDGINFIKQNSQISVLLVEKPKFSGNWNINYQAFSTCAGINYLQDKHQCEYTLKIRGDFIFDPLVIFINKCFEHLEKYPNELSFLGICYTPMMTVLKLEVFFLDFMTLGRSSTQLAFWEFEHLASNGLPFPEKFLEKRFYKSQNFVKRNLLNFSNKNLIEFNDYSVFWLKKELDFRNFKKNYKNKYVLIMKPSFLESMIAWLQLLRNKLKKI